MCNVYVKIKHVVGGLFLVVCMVWFLNLRWFLKKSSKLCLFQDTVFVMFALLLTVLCILYGQCLHVSSQLTGKIILPTVVCLN